MIKEMHYAQNDKGLVLAVAAKKDKLPKIKGAKIVAVPLTKAQMMLVEDGFPPELFRTQEQRRAYWEANPPRAMPSWSSEAARREKELAALRTELTPEPVTKAPVKKKAKPVEAKIDTDAMEYDHLRLRWRPRPGYKPDQKKPTKKASSGQPLQAKVAAGKIDLKLIKKQFDIKPDSFREKLLEALVANKDKITSIEDLAKAVYGSKKKAPACVMVMKGLSATIDKKSLPWAIDKSDKGYQLFEG